MNKTLSRERRRAVVLAGSSAALAGLPAVLGKSHHVLLGFCIAVQLGLIAAALVQFRKAMKTEKEQR